MSCPNLAGLLAWNTLSVVFGHPEPLSRLRAAAKHAEWACVKPQILIPGPVFDVYGDDSSMIIAGMLAVSFAKREMLTVTGR